MRNFYINPWKLFFYITIIIFLTGIYLFFIEEDLVNGIALLSITATIYIGLLFASIEKSDRFARLTFIILIALIILTISILAFSIFASNEIKAIKTLGIIVAALVYIARTVRIETSP